jgi:hypothetical protein
MALTFTFELVTTNNAGVIQDQTEIDAYIINKFTVDETVGDELYLKSGDLLLETFTELTHNGSYENWIFFYINDDLFNVYYYEDETGVELDQKRNKYRYRFISIQQKFYNDANATDLQANTSDTDYWNYGLNSIAVAIHSLAVTDGDGDGNTFTGRWAFPIGLMLDGLSGKTNDYNYEIDTIDHNIPVIGYEIPVVWRGRGIKDSESDFNAITDTFNYHSIAEDYIFEFTVTGVGVIPEEDSIYSNNSSHFRTISTEISGAAGTITMERLNNYENDPSASGTLTKISGTGDASITFNSVSDESDYEGIDFDFNWWDVIKLCSIYENGFIHVEPKEESSTLKIDITIHPRAKTAGLSIAENIVWIERKKIEKQYIVDGVTLSCTNADYTLGNVDTRNQFTRTVPAADPERANDNWYSDLNFGVTEQYLGGGYDYQNPEGLFWNGGGVPLLDATYQDIIDGLDGYEGKILPYYTSGGSDYAVRLLRQLELSGGVELQTISIKIKKRGFATIKAMEML